MSRNPRNNHSDTEATMRPDDRHGGARSKSMHEGIAVWCDCCSCEMEPYWAEVAREMGVEFSDYEE